jgi:hypothetical protein
MLKGAGDASAGSTKCVALGYEGPLRIPSTNVWAMSILSGHLSPVPVTGGERPIPPKSTVWQDRENRLKLATSSP